VLENAATKRKIAIATLAIVSPLDATDNLQDANMDMFDNLPNALLCLLFVHDRCSPGANFSSLGALVCAEADATSGNAHTNIASDRTSS